MQQVGKTFAFVFFATVLWNALVTCINKLAQYYPEVINRLPGFHVEYDSYSGHYLFVEGSYGFELYPILLLALLTVIFLWKTEFPVDTFILFSIMVPFVVNILALVVSSFLSPSQYIDDSSVSFILTYIMPLTGFLSGAFFYSIIKKCQKRGVMATQR